MSAHPAVSDSAFAPEDAARANVYGLLARLLYAPADRALLARLAAADDIDAQEAGSRLAPSWRELKASAATADEAAVRTEFEALYVGTGKALVSPYAGAYLEGSGPQRRLVELRQFLAQHELARQPGVHEPEDHMAALCDVMRHLLSTRDASLPTQGEFFERYLWQPACGFCDASAQAEPAAFYRRVADFARSFLEIEYRMFESMI